MSDPNKTLARRQVQLLMRELAENIDKVDSINLNWDGGLSVTCDVTYATPIEYQYMVLQLPLKEKKA